MKETGRQLAYRKLGENLAWVMIAVGFLAIAVAFLLDPNTFWHKLLYGSGSSILGSGVFLAIVKSVQFTRIFKSHLFGVINDPYNNLSPIDIRKQWEIITDALLKNVLPTAFHNATQKIKNQLFDDELEYHFVDYSAAYELKLDIKNDSLFMVAEISTWLHASPAFDDPKLVQTHIDDGSTKLEILTVDDVDVLKHASFEPDKKNPPRQKNSWAVFGTGNAPSA
ncbi:MAG: hypothetical protein RQ899_13450, partial [Pseudomonadales bacterium]|nr:hypothetical protein [Pseudomonadales bacterium]